MSAAVEAVPASGMHVLSINDLTQRLGGSVFALDVETTPLPEYTHKDAALLWHQSKVIGASLACPPNGVQTYAPLDDERRPRFVSWLHALLTRPDTTVVGHNIKFDLHALGIDPNSIQAKIEDTSVITHLLEPTEPKKLELCEIRWLSTTRKRDHLAAAPRGGVKHFADWPFEQQAAYAGDDAVIPYELWQKLCPMIGQQKLESLFRKEMRYLKALWSVERRGILLDVNTAQTMQSALRERQHALEQQLYDLIGHPVLWTSPQQLSKALYEELGVPRPEPPDRQLSPVERRWYTSCLTSSELLSRQVQHPAAGLILAIREAAKLATTLETWQLLTDNEPALHTSLNQTGTVTGRLSSSRPNLQNVATQTRRNYTLAESSGISALREEYAQLRRALIARPGYQFVSLDSQQQEVRMLGILSGDEGLLERLRVRSDVHRDTAELVFGNRDDLHRTWAKNITFALTYGLGQRAMAEQLGLTESEASALVQRYWQKLPGVHEYAQAAEATCERFGYVRLWDGRLWYPTGPSMEYKALNGLIQGGCAELLSIILLRIWQYLNETGAGHIVLPIHDELLCEIREDAVEDVLPNLLKLMEAEDLFDIPFFAEAKIGQNFGALTKWNS